MTKDNSTLSFLKGGRMIKIIYGFLFRLALSAKRFNLKLFLFGTAFGILLFTTVNAVILKPKPVIITNTKIIEVPHEVIREEIVRVPVKLTVEDKKQIHCMADNAYYEARGEVREGIIAVNNVVLNRTKDSEKFGNNACSVIKKKYNGSCAFSWVCDNTIDEREKNPAVYGVILRISQDVYLQNIHDVTDGATYFHSVKIRNPWNNVTKTIKIGNQIFYREASIRS